MADESTNAVNNAVNSETADVDGASLQADGSRTDYQTRASNFIQSTSLDDMHAIAEAALRKKMEAPPKWVFPEGGIQKP